MRTQRLMSFALVALALCVALPLHAQERRRVTVLAFDAADTQQDAATALYGAVRTQVAYHRDLALNDVPPQRLDDLLLAVGCTTLDGECAELVQMVTEADWLVFGEVGQTETALTVFDVVRGQPVRTVRLQRTPDAWQDRDDVLLARHLLWGNVGTLSVTSEPPGATVYLDDVLVGVTPVEASQLALRGSVLRVERPGFAPWEARVEVDLGLTEANARLTPLGVAEIETPRERSGSGRAGAWVTSGAGAALLAAGLVTGIESRQNQAAFDRAVDDVELDRDRAETLRDRGTRQSRAANVLLPLGATTLAGGVVWLIVQGRAGEEAADRAASLASGRLTF